MSDELSPEMLEEAAPDLLTLEDEDGKIGRASCRERV